MNFEDYSSEVQDIIIKLGILAYSNFRKDFSDSEILQKCSNNSMEDIVQNYREQITDLKITKSEMIQEMQNKHSDEIQNIKNKESENIENRLNENNNFHKMEKHYLNEKLSTLEKENMTLKEENFTLKDEKEKLYEKFVDKKDFTNPTEQGDYAEKILDDIINEGLPYDDKVYIEDTSGYGGSGDRIITFSNGCRIMVEVKNKNPVKKSDIDEFEKHYSKDFEEDKVDYALFLSYRTTQIPQKCKAIIPESPDNDKVIYYGMDDSDNKEEKKLKIQKCLEELFKISDKNKKLSKKEKELTESNVEVYNMYLRNLVENVTNTDKSIKKQTIELENLRIHRQNIETELNKLYKIIHLNKIIVDPSLLDKKMYRNVLIKRIKEWCENVDEKKKSPQTWKKNIKVDMKGLFSEYDLEVLSSIKHGDIKIV